MATEAREIPPEIVEQFRELFPEYEDLEDLLQYQESVFQSHQTNITSNRVDASNNDQISDSRHNSGTGVISRSESVDSELAEALALSLQFADDDLENASTSESAGTASGSRGSSSTETSVVVVSEDDVDPDNMTYEQLQSITEAVGNESKGLSKELLSSLPSQKIKGKTGWFASKKTEYSECVICYMEYKKGEWLTTLPCMHQYHMKCIKRWLGDHKTCPICNNEISESGTSSH